MTHTLEPLRDISGEAAAHALLAIDEFKRLIEIRDLALSHRRERFLVEHRIGKQPREAHHRRGAFRFGTEDQSPTNERSHIFRGQAHKRSFKSSRAAPNVLPKSESA